MDFSFEANEKYYFRMWDSSKEYYGTITTLPQIEITMDTVIADQIILQWTDVNADFYDVEFRDWPNFEKHYQVESTQFKISVDSVYGDNIDITIAGFKGFNPITNPNGNIKGCYGYLFGYTDDETTLDISTMTFSKPTFYQSPPNLDKFVLSFLKNNETTTNNISQTKPRFQFTYGSLYNSSYSSSGWSDFYSTTVVEPANSITTFEGYLNDIQLDSYNWAGFIYHLQQWDDVYDTYDKDMLFTFRLAINNQLDSATVANPDTFSILTHPPTDSIPVAPFEISWRRPYNADFFLVDACWEVEGDSLDKNFLYVTENTSLVFTQIPDSVVEGSIYVIAIAGASPMKEMEPNLVHLNGYFFSRRSCRNYLYFRSNSLQKKSRELYSIDNIKSKLNRNIDDFLLSILTEKYPELCNYKINLSE